MFRMLDGLINYKRATWDSRPKFNTVNERKRMTKAEKRLLIGAGAATVTIFVLASAARDLRAGVIAVVVAWVMVIAVLYGIYRAILYALWAFDGVRIFRDQFQWIASILGDLFGGVSRRIRR